MVPHRFRSESVPRGPVPTRAEHFWNGPAGLVRLAVVAFLPVLIAAAPVSTAAEPEPGQVLGAAVHPFGADRWTVTTERVPLVEVFTATWCPPCAPADRALDRLLDEHAPALARAPNGSAWPPPDAAPSRLAVLAYHPHPDIVGEDRFGVPEGQHRLTSKHGAFWFPSVYVDGIFEDAAQTRTLSVDAGMEEVLHGSYTTLVQSARGIPAQIGWNITATTDGRNVTVIAEWTAQADVDGPVYLQGALWEDHIRFAGSNGVDDHRMTVRALLPRHAEPGGLRTGATGTVTWSLAVPSETDLSRAGITVFGEAAWTQPAAPGGAPLMAFAMASAGVGGITVAGLRLARRRRAS